MLEIETVCGHGYVHTEADHVNGECPRRRSLSVGCNYCEKYGHESGAPSHDASHACKSGQSPHCTCDTCY